MPNELDVIQEEIEQLEEAIPKLEEKLDEVTMIAYRDGDVTKAEQKTLDAVSKSIEDKKKALSEKRDEFDELTGQISFDEGEEITVALKPYDDQSFISDFQGSIVGWTRDGAISLNSVKTYMIERKEPTELSVSDIISVVETVFPAAGAVKTAWDLGQIAKTAFEQALRSSNGPTPSLNEIHVAWNDAINAMRDTGKLAKLYDAFVVEYKKENDIPLNVDQAVAALFAPACRAYAQTHLPSATDIQKAFVSYIINKTVQDEDYPWCEGDDIAGWAIIDVTAPGGITEDALMSPVRGYLDDVPKDLMQAFSTVYKGERITNVPIKIQFHIRNNMGAGHTIVERASPTAGNTSFKMKSGEEAFYKAFMAKKVWERAGVNMLKADG